MREREGPAMASEGLSRRDFGLLAGGAAGAAMLAGGLGAKAAQDPFADLAADHRRIAETLAAMQRTEDSATNERVRLLGELKRALSEHAAVEEYVLYPAFRQNPDNKRLTQDLFAEHAEVKTMLYELELTPRSDVRWKYKATDLRRLLEAHMRREEEEVFPKHRASLNPTQLEFLSQLAQRERGQA
jgi:iron-sulfur cluster repair protein YtfE (RIC family)